MIHIILFICIKLLIFNVTMSALFMTNCYNYNQLFLKLFIFFSDPCDDFYQFACGGWIQRSVVTNTDRFTGIDKRNQNIIAKVLAEDIEDKAGKILSYFQIENDLQ